MALLKPDGNLTPPELKTESQETWQEIQCKLVTPIYGGGIHASRPDFSMPVRVAAIRGQLRFWWRLLAQKQWNLHGDALREAEFRLWGGIGEKASSSLVFLRVHDVSTAVPISYFAGDIKARLPADKKERSKNKNKDLSDYAYVLFPMDSAEEREDTLLIKEGLTWKLQWRLGEGATKKAPEKDGQPKAGEERISDQEQVLETLRWWATFGGIGARTRRGCGAFVVKESSEPRLKQPVSPSEAAQVGCKLVLRPSSNHALTAWKEAVQSLRDFRQGVGVGRNPPSDAARMLNKPAGRSRWAEPDEIRRITHTHQSDHKPEHKAGDLFARGVFGMPIIFHFVGKDEPSDATLQPRNKERMASPLILRPVADGKGGFQAAALRLPLDNVLNLKVELQHKGQKTGVTLWDKEKAQHVRPIQENGGGNPIDAFLNYFEK